MTTLAQVPSLGTTIDACGGPTAALLPEESDVVGDEAMWTERIAPSLEEEIA